LQGAYVLYLGELSFYQHSGGACCLHCCQHCIFISNAIALYILWLQSSHAQIIVYLGFGAKHNDKSTSQFCTRACQTVVTMQRCPKMRNSDHKMYYLFQNTCLIKNLTMK